VRGEARRCTASSNRAKVAATLEQGGGATLSRYDTPCSPLKIFYLLLSGCLVYSSSLMIEAVNSSEASMNFYLTINRHIPEDNTFHTQL
jgi:hypothetical protein